MDNKQTAVEWLVKYLSDRGYIQAPSFGHSIIDKGIEQAKEMEKQQIMDSYIMGSYDMAAKEFRPEQYYNETFKKEQND